MSQPTPTDIRLHQKSHVLEVAFDDGSRFEFPCEFLRVFSPSAEVQGHGPGQERLQWGKKDVNITSVQPVGNYAVQLYFDDGHDTGIYSWDLLYRFGANQDQMWQDYLAQVEQAGVSREPVDPGAGAVDANAPYRGGNGG